MNKFLFVCMGNICRSPMALAITAQMAEMAGMKGRLEFDSAGTHGSHAGERPDGRGIATLRRHGYEAPPGRSRRVVAADFQRFDLVLAMDSNNIKNLQNLCPPNLRHKIHKFTDFADQPQIKGVDMPDPYYSQDAGFEQVLQMCESSARGLLGVVARLPAAK